MRKPKKYDSTEVQGDGSYIVMFRRTHAQAKEMRQKDPTTTETDEQLEKWMAEALVEWNWTDKKGKPLPLPSEDPTVWHDMPEDEGNFIIRCWLGRVDPKNSDSTSIAESGQAAEGSPKSSSST